MPKSNPSRRQFLAHSAAAVSAAAVFPSVATARRSAPGKSGTIPHRRHRARRDGHGSLQQHPRVGQRWTGRRRDRRTRRRVRPARRTGRAGLPRGSGFHARSLPRSPGTPRPRRHPRRAHRQPRALARAARDRLDQGGQGRLPREADDAQPASTRSLSAQEGRWTRTPHMRLPGRHAVHDAARSTTRRRS